MDTAIGTFQAAITPKHGKIRPVDIFWLGRREIDEKTVTNLREALARDDSFFHPILVRDEGATGYRLISGLHRVEASKRHSGEEAPLSAIICPAHTPDALIAILEIEENLLRKELTAAERERQTILLAAALKELDGEKLATELPVSASKGKSATTGGRGKKAMTARLADQLRLSKPAVQKRMKLASARIGEKIDLDRDTPAELERKAAELERKAAERQYAEPKAVLLRRRKPARRVEDPTPPAEPHAGVIGSKIEVARKAFDALASKDQFRFIHDICLSVGLDPLKMASPAVFGLAEEEPELAENAPAAVAPATDDALPEQAEHGDEAAVAHAEEDDEAAAVQSNQGDNGAEFGAEDLQDAGDDVPDAADPEIGVTKCAHCKEPFLSSDLPRMKYGRLYHRKNCVNHAKPIAIAA